MDNPEDIALLLRREWEDTDTEATWIEYRNNKIQQIAQREILPVVHPAFHGRQFSIYECQNIAVTTGISPGLVGAVLSGRVRPNEEICTKLTAFFDEDTIRELRDDFNPIRDFFFVPSFMDIALENYAFNAPTNYKKCGNLSTADILLCDDGRGLVVSDVKVGHSRTVVFSGAAMIGSYPNILRVTARSPVVKQDNVAGGQGTTIRQDIYKEMMDTYGYCYREQDIKLYDNNSQAGYNVDTIIAETGESRRQRLQSMISDITHYIEHQESFRR